MSLKQRILLSVLSGVLFVPAWYSWGSGFFLFFAFIPMLIVEADLVKSGRNTREFFLLPFLTFIIWNVLATWWIKNASFAGVLVAVVLNSTFMAIPFWLFTLTHRRLGNSFGYFSLLFYWITFEYFYLNAEISWTWLNLGNGFANNIRSIQWYEYTGTLGGTLWVLAINLLLFNSFLKFMETRKLKSSLTGITLALFIFLLPLILSLSIFKNYREKADPYEIVVIQPNIDPYMKFNDIPPDEQVEIFIHLVDSACDSSTDYIVVPETFINDNVWLHELHMSPSIRKVEELSARYPGAKIVIGATTYQLYPSAKEASPTARPFRGQTYYDSFNSALQIDTSGIIPVYHKSQLVVGVEKMPYTQYLGFLRKIMLHLGGTFRSHGTQDHRETFASPQDSLKVGAAICYESIFGEFVTDYVKEAGANFIFVITNDGWWGNTPGYVQHNSFSALRAIENRRSIARSANTGISSFFNQKGEMLQKIGWWKRAAIKETLNANDKITFYTRHGDYIGRVSAFLAIALFLYTLTSLLMKKKV